MPHIPLRPFLTVLQADGIRVTTRDIDRIVTVLRTGDTWTLERLRDTLLALLAKNVDQRDLLARRFDEFFPSALRVDPCLAALDLKRALAEVRQLGASAPSAGSTARRARPKTPIQSAAGAALPSQARRPARNRLLALLAVLFVGVGVLLFLRRQPPTSLQTGQPTLPCQ